MSEQLERRLSDRIADPSYVTDLQARTMDQLQDMRREAQAYENDISFERRLTQARIDILTAELDHRAGRVEGDVMSRLANILADDDAGDNDSGPLPSRVPDLSVPASAQRPRRRVEEIVGADTLARLTKLPESEIRSSIESLAEHEQTLSARRKTVHDVLDQIQAEIVRRYTSGEEDPSKLLS
ncbi:MAG: hypothetical protein KY391_00150 [Actinobacteria bacterium]|nr:hypothetical protein [Actinomycetota bacterium]